MRVCVCVCLCACVCSCEHLCVCGSRSGCQHTCAHARVRREGEGEARRTEGVDYELDILLRVGRANCQLDAVADRCVHQLMRRPAHTQEGGRAGGRAGRGGGCGWEERREERNGVRKEKGCGSDAPAVSVPHASPRLRHGLLTLYGAVNTRALREAAAGRATGETSATPGRSGISFFSSISVKISACTRRTKSAWANAGHTRAAQGQPCACRSSRQAPCSCRPSPSPSTRPSAASHLSRRAVFRRLRRCTQVRA